MTAAESRRILVLKVGGGTGGASGALSDLPALLGEFGVAIVHGGGPEVSRWLERLALPVRFKNGLRITDLETLQVATMVLRGAVSTGLVAGLAGLGVRAVGLSGVDGGLLQAVPHEDPELGYVGQAGAVQPDILRLVIDHGMVPLVAPLALDRQGQLRNVNADTVCGAIAGALRADLVVFLTDVPGVLDRHGSVITHVQPDAIEYMIDDGRVHGGMVPKVRACLAALAHGAHAVCIADGRTPGTLQAIVAGTPGYGTIISADA